MSTSLKIYTPWLQWIKSQKLNQQHHNCLDFFYSCFVERINIVQSPPNSHLAPKIGCQNHEWVHEPCRRVTANYLINWMNLHAFKALYNCIRAHQGFDALELNTPHSSIKRTIFRHIAHSVALHSTQHSALRCTEQLYHKMWGWEGRAAMFARYIETLY